jgi:leader peptidase (prepilin peptidase)/N-methyltransferase
VSRLRWVGVAVWSALAVVCLVVLDLPLEAIVGAAGCAVLVAVSVTDLERRIIPNRIVVPATVAALAVQTVRDPSVEWIVAALCGGGVFLLLALVHPAGLGMGDVKLAAFLGAWLGRNVIVALFAGSILSLAPAIAVLAARGAAGRKVGLPFAPFLAAGGVVAVFVGDRLVDWWIG